MRKFLIYFSLFFIPLTPRLFAQDSTFYAPPHDQLALGVGLGLDFGGLGGNLLVCPGKNIGFFLGVGYAFVKAGFNAGMKVRFIPPKKRRLRLRL